MVLQHATKLKGHAIEECNVADMYGNYQHTGLRDENEHNEKIKILKYNIYLHAERRTD